MFRERGIDIRGEEELSQIPQMELFKRVFPEIEQSPTFAEVVSMTLLGTGRKVPENVINAVCIPLNGKMYGSLRSVFDSWNKIENPQMREALKELTIMNVANTVAMNNARSTHEVDHRKRLLRNALETGGPELLEMLRT